MKNNSTNSSSIILSNYIKFDRLNQICGSVFAEMPTKIDIYIDINSILYGLLTSTYEPAFDTAKNAITSNIINMIAHYRRFFWGYKIQTRFFLIFSNLTDPSPRKFVPEYNASNIFRMNEKTINTHLWEQLNLMTEICKYIPNTCIQVTAFEPSVLMYHIMGLESHNEDKGDVNIIITKDIVTMQLAAIEPNTIVFRPSKYKGEDNSYFVSPINGGLFRSLTSKRKTKYKDEWDTISPALYSLVLAASRVPERDIKSLLSIPDAFDVILKVISSGKVLNGYNLDIINFCDAIEDKSRTKLLHGNIEGRFKALDLIYNYNILWSSPEVSLYQGCRNLYDPNGIHDIDTEFFKDCHLNLEYL